MDVSVPTGAEEEVSGLGSDQCALMASENSMRSLDLNAGLVESVLTPGLA